MAASCSVFLNVWDIAKSLEFYEGLGFEVAGRHERRGVTTYADLELDGAELGLGNIRSNDEPAFRAWVDTPLGAGVVVYLTVPDVDACFERARRLGATIEVPLEDRSYGRVFTLNDPDGYTLTFLQEPLTRKVRSAASKPKRAPRKPARTPAKRRSGSARGCRRLRARPSR